MNGFVAVVVITALFVLRIAVPLVLAWAVCCGMNGLQKRWGATT